MSLVWKLLRQHISIGQLAGFFFANLLGMLIVLLSVQFYQDVKPAFSQEDSFLKGDYLIVSKTVTVIGGSSTFTEAELDDIRRQPFCSGLGKFTATQFQVKAAMGVGDLPKLTTDMFFESVPDEFVDAKTAQWHYTEGQDFVPIILPRSYLAIYNFGFAPTQGLPRITEDMISMVNMDLLVRGTKEQLLLKGKVVGFSNRLNTILAPEGFVRWSNEKLAPGSDDSPTRLIVEVKNPADDRIMQYFDDRGFDIADDKLDAGRTMFFLRLVSAIVMAIGLLISILSFYILMLSIYLLVQKNTYKLQNLILIGYTHSRVSLPYQLLTVGMNSVVLILSFSLLLIVRAYYIDLLWSVYPQMSGGSIIPALLLGIFLFLLVTLLNTIAIRNKVNECNSINHS